MDMGGRRIFGYRHAIVARDQVFLHEGISPLSWIGIASQTGWVSLSQGKSESAADCIQRLCEVFVGAVPTLLEGLSHDLPEPEVRAWRSTFTIKHHRKNGFTVLLIESAELRDAFRNKASWEVPTSIIPEGLRQVDSRFAIVQDPSYTRESSDALAMRPAYRHLRIESTG